MSKLPTLEQFQGIVQKLLGENFGEFLELSQAETPAHLRILRVKAKGKDNDVPVRWFYYLVSDPEGRQVTFSFRVEEKRLEQFGRADEQLVHSLRFVRSGEEGNGTPRTKKEPPRSLAGPVAALVKSSRRLRLDASLRDERGVGRAKHLPLIDPGSR